MRFRIQNRQPFYHGENVMKEIVFSDKNAATKTQVDSPIAFIQLDQELDIKSRKIFLSNIDIYSPAFIQQRAEVIYELSHDKTSPITVSISSYGGEVYGMFGVVDVINHLPTPVNTIGVGTVQSAATTILACGTGKRTLTKNTFVMIHQISTWFGGQTEDISVEAKHTKDLQELLYQTLGQRSSKDTKFWRSNCKRNLYLPAGKCLEYGLIDEII